MSSFPYRNPVIFDWHSPSELSHVWEEAMPAQSTYQPRPIGKTGYPTAAFFPALAPPSAHPFPYASTQFSPPINYSYDNGAEAPLGSDADMMLVVDSATRQVELPVTSPPPLPPPEAASASLPLVEMTDAVPQEMQPILLVKDDSHRFRSKRPVPLSAEDHPTSAIGDDDADYMDEEPSSHSTMVTRSKSARVARSRRRRHSDGESDDFILSTEHDEEDDEMSGPIHDSHHVHNKATALTPEEQEECDQVHLGASKSPIMQALVYCALRGWGLRLVKNEGDDVRFAVEDFPKYYRCSAYICAKQNPTDDQSSRIKALKRWFPDFPTKREHEALFESAFDIQVQRGKDNKPKKIKMIIDEVKNLIEAENRAKARKRIR